VENADRRYWAFISYSHHDRRVARRLVKHLKRARVPRAFRDRVSSRSPRFSDIFLDTSEAAASPHLSTELQDALRASNALIVVCSPFAVASAHVADEIAYFSSLGRADRILCLVASGVPNAADEGRPALECFPRPLRFRVAADGTVTDEPVPSPARPLAASLGEESDRDWRQAENQLVAGLLDVSVGELARLRTRRRLFQVAGAGASALAMAGVAAFVWWGWFAPVTGYYKSYVRKFGIWEGVHRVSAAQAQRMESVYAITTKGEFGLPTEARRVNGYGRCPEDGQLERVVGSEITDPCGVTARRTCAARFEYNADGTIATEELLDQFGGPVEKLLYEDAVSAQFREAGFGCSCTSTGIEYVRFDYYPGDGLVRRASFFAKDRKPTVNEEGAYAINYGYDQDGNYERVWYSNPEGGMQVAANGATSSISSYDAEGNRIEFRHLDKKEEPINYEDAGIGSRMSYDQTAISLKPSPCARTAQHDRTAKALLAGATLTTRGATPSRLVHSTPAVGRHVVATAPPAGSKGSMAQACWWSSFSLIQRGSQWWISMGTRGGSERWMPPGTWNRPSRSSAPTGDR
jgi:hypothetical protein